MKNFPELKTAKIVPSQKLSTFRGGQAKSVCDTCSYQQNCMVDYKVSKSANAKAKKAASCKF
jgi:hypothetical protein